MNKILLIIRREYLTRVRKKSFIIMTLLAPVFMGTIWVVPIWLAVQGDTEQKVIEVVDESGLFKDKFRNKKNLTFNFINNNINEAKEGLKNNDHFGILYVPKLDLDDPKGITFFSWSNPSVSLESTLENAIKDQIEDIKLRESGIDKAMLERLKTFVDIQTINLGEDGEKESNSGVATVVGIFSAIILYFFLFFYGAQVMRSVMEEKTSRIVEVIVSSVKPFQLMMGKIIGVAGVGLTQFLLWIILTLVVGVSVLSFFNYDMSMMQNPEQVQEIMAQLPDSEKGKIQAIDKAMHNIKTIPIAKIFFSFIFYFLGGYFIYAALFAMIGSAIDHESDSQQFMFPLILPLIISISISGAIIQEPNSSLAFWLSMIPLTSPVVMMIRLPFDIPAWELFLSMFLLVTFFLLATWVAGRVYRVGILMHGSKVNYRTLARWFFMRN
ncbi:ABC transporter permease [Fulvivirgaceae bacterium BMA10]|uniref:ABC transporter permease n=1 Tax=Splendidivirga corallicola TaxID=3051826 RepID=A0ABT8KII9_9BACT|nr:ABC transporter permease [Fulvivirgaceae bacterium BMA10]